MADAPPGAAGAAAAHLVARPNPFRDGVRLIAPRVASGGARLIVTDVAGRVVARPIIDPARGEGVWDGCDTHGRPVPAGIYLARCEAAGRTLRCRLVKLDRRP